MALGAAVGPSGLVLDVDISVPQLRVAEAARDALGERGRHIQFRIADAQTATDLWPGGESGGKVGFDLVFSQLGLMFFDDPLAGFTNP